MPSLRRVISCSKNVLVHEHTCLMFIACKSNSDTDINTGGTSASKPASKSGNIKQRQLRRASANANPPAQGVSGRKASKASKEEKRLLDSRDEGHFSDSQLSGDQEWQRPEAPSISKSAQKQSHLQRRAAAANGQEHVKRSAILTAGMMDVSATAGVRAVVEQQPASMQARPSAFESKASLLPRKSAITGQNMWQEQRQRG